MSVVGVDAYCNGLALEGCAERGGLCGLALGREGSIEDCLERADHEALTHLMGVGVPRLDAGARPRVHGVPPPLVSQSPHHQKLFVVREDVIEEEQKHAWKCLLIEMPAARTGDVMTTSTPASALLESLTNLCI